MLMTPANYVIRKFGGLTKTARAYDCPITTVQGWRVRGKVPQEHWMPLIEVAKKIGETIEIEDFLRNHEVDGEAA